MSGELFDHVLIIQLEMKDGKLTHKVGYQFPPAQDGDGSSEETGTVVQFCFPEECIPKRARGFGDLRRTSETFSFALTATDGSKRFGYCRRFLDGDKAECCCIISLVPSMALFCSLLDIVEERRKTSQTAVFTFLKTVLAHPFPDPGASFSVRTFGSSGSGGPDEYTLTRPATENLGDFVSLSSSLFSHLSVADVVELWQGILLERRVLVVAADLENLSGTVNALAALMFPFSWQHVFIPILPKSLAGYVTAPMPFLIGCLQGSLAAIRDMGMPLEEIFLVDAANGAILMRPSDAPDLLPKDLAASLRNSLCAVIASSDSPRDKDLAISRAFLRCLQSAIGDYTRWFTRSAASSQSSSLSKKSPSAQPSVSASGLKFDTAGFLASTSGECRAFVQAFTGSQSWFMFFAQREEMAARGELKSHCPLLVPITNPIPSRTVAALPDSIGASAVCSAAGCGAAMRGDEICSVWGGKVYHTRCFTCATCGRLLEGSVLPSTGTDPSCARCTGFVLGDDLPSSGSAPKSLREVWSSMKKFWNKDRDRDRDKDKDREKEKEKPTDSTANSEGKAEAKEPDATKQKEGGGYFQFRSGSLRKGIAATLRGMRHKDGDNSPPPPSDSPSPTLDDTAQQQAQDPKLQEQMFGKSARRKMTVYMPTDESGHPNPQQRSQGDSLTQSCHARKASFEKRPAMTTSNTATAPATPRPFASRMASGEGGRNVRRSLSDPDMSGIVASALQKANATGSMGSTTHVLRKGTGAPPPLAKVSAEARFAQASHPDGQQVVRLRPTQPPAASATAATPTPGATAATTATPGKRMPSPATVAAVAALLNTGTVSMQRARENSDSARPKLAQHPPTPTAPLPPTPGRKLPPGQPSGQPAGAHQGPGFAKREASMPGLSPRMTVAFAPGQLQHHLSPPGGPQQPPQPQQRRALPSPPQQPQRT